MLNANRTWDDRGTGHVSSSYIDRLNGMSLLVKAETDGSTLLESKIMADTAYQKQQDTLIVWSEGENYDLALSFQERIGCEEIWAKICQVQGKDPSVDITQDLIEDEDNELPPVEINRLDELISILNSCLTMATKKDIITLALENDNYILKLLELFRQLEDQKDIVNLQKIYEIFKSIFLFNKNSLIEIMLSDNAISDVIGVFEYDPNGARVREFIPKEKLFAKNNSKQEDLLQSSSVPIKTTRAHSSQSTSYFTSLPFSNENELMQVIPLSKSELVSKIHQTYRVQYIQDVIMPTPSVFEENTLSTLSSMLFFNKIEIVTLIQEDEKFLKELFKQLSDDSPSFIEKRRDLVLFLKELCTFSHTLQNRETFIKTLSSFGLLQTIETLLVCEDPIIKLGSVDLLTYIVDYSPSLVREYALQQEISDNKSTDQFIINIIIEQLICDSDPDLGMAQQLSGILKMIIDPDNMLTTPGLSKTEKSEFLNYFYKNCIYFLTEPIMAATISTDCKNQISIHSSSPCLEPDSVSISSKNFSENVPSSANNQSTKLAFENSCQAAQLLAIILELLTFCIEHHAKFLGSYYNQIFDSIIFVAVIRFMRKLVGLKDEFYNRHIVTLNLFQPIIEAFLSNKGRYNLLDSAVIDLFEFITHNDIQTLLTYTIERFWRSKLEFVNYVRTFKSLKRHYDNHPNRTNDQNALNYSQRSRFRRDPRQLDKEEDLWFNTDEDEDEDDCAEDDDDDECENYHEEEDDDDENSSSIPQSLENHLTSLPDSIISDYAHPYESLSLHHSKHSPSNPLGSAISHHHHPLQLSSLHQSISGNATNSSSSTLTGFDNISATNSVYDSSGPVAFVDSPFFSSLAAAASNNTTVSGSVSNFGPGISSRKKNHRKLTISLNHKTGGLFNSSVTINPTFPNNLSNQANNNPQSGILGAFSSGLCSLSINNAAVTTTTTTGLTGVSSVDHGTSIFSSIPYQSLSSMRSTSNISIPDHTINAQHLNRNDSKSDFIIKKALVDYPDEDSDEDKDHDEPENNVEENSNSLKSASNFDLSPSSIHSVRDIPPDDHESINQNVLQQSLKCSPNKIKLKEFAPIIQNLNGAGDDCRISSKEKKDPEKNLKRKIINNVKTSEDANDKNSDDEIDSSDISNSQIEKSNFEQSEHMEHSPSSFVPDKKRVRYSETKISSSSTPSEITSDSAECSLTESSSSQAKLQSNIDE
ncbi:Serine/threonine-protein phosphatase 4 regulatory subunit 3 [Sarcoptes scabiei]|uniref:Serine/threonine-protein phosphatase 4 regulatory subunit 3 n=1 Tax=Sarcoptes scabiei TaxID=52283 RepID=A0A834V9E7_SARSC|nr:Serine/threonine-protein phosphatase 4 regulatory subunit 3 [Sarcoptes scabiei]